jgi:glutaredoxin 3
VVLERVDDRPLGLGQRTRRGVRSVGQWGAEGGDHERVGVFVQSECARFAGAADHAAGGSGEADEVLALAAACAAGELGCEAGGQQQFQAEGERVGAAGAVGFAVEQGELVGEQVVDARVGVAVVEDAGDGLAGAGGAVQRCAMFAQARVGGDGLGRGDGQEVAAALIEDELEPEERFEAPAEARAGFADTLGDGAQAPAGRRVEVQNPVGLAVAERAEDDAFGFYRSGYRTILSEAMSQITVYTTEPCGYCRVAKALLNKRGVPFQEINLAKDPEGRAELVRLTGMMTFPQVVIDGNSIGGYQELVAFDKDGGLAEFAAAA